MRTRRDHAWRVTKASTLPAGSSKNAIHSVSPAGPNGTVLVLMDGVRRATELNALGFQLGHARLDVVRPQVEHRVAAGLAALEKDTHTVQVEEHKPGRIEARHEPATENVAVESLGHV